MYDDVVFACRFLYQLTKFGIRVLIGLSRLLHAPIAYEIYNAKNINRLPCPNDKIYDDAVFADRSRYQLAMFGIDRAISIPSCSYCIWNRYIQNHLSILLNFVLSAWFDTVEFNRAPCSNNKIYDYMVFADWFRYQLTMFEVCVLIGLSRLLDTYIAYSSYIENHHW